jgi:hypothetical protein
MTIKEVYEYVLIEENKRKAPALLLKDFNYFFWKALVNYCNIRYNDYDKNQQRIDDLDAFIEVDKNISLSLVGRRYAGDLPADYLHILNCEVVFEVAIDHLCYEAGDVFNRAAHRLPTGSATSTLNNYYFKPSITKPYFYQNKGSLEIRSGDASKYIPKEVYIDYLVKAEQYELTQDHIEEVGDTSPTLPLSDYVAMQVINELMKILLENTSDPRLQTNVPINQTVA